MPAHAQRTSPHREHITQYSMGSVDFVKVLGGTRSGYPANGMPCSPEHGFTAQKQMSWAEADGRFAGRIDGVRRNML